MANESAGRPVKADRYATWFSQRLFTAQSVGLHLVAFAIAWQVEGSDHHLFLDAISVEAVLVTLLVGIATRRAEQQRAVLEQLDRERLKADLDMDVATNHLLKLQVAEVQRLAELSKAIHDMSTEMHMTTTERKSK